MMSLFLFILVAAIAWAKMEIEIEGKHGWAEKLPTWRIEKHLLLDLFYGGRPLTGYHVWAFSFVFLSFHLPFFGSVPWTWRAECRAIAAYDLFWVLEDVLWFILNPHYGWKNFHKEFVWWHRRWFLGLPVDYWVLLAIAGGLFALSVPPR